MTEPFEDWAQQDGRIVAQPVLGFDAATFPGHALLRVVYAASQEQLDQQVGRHIQFAMTPVQARELSRALADMAEKAERTA